MNRIVRLTPEGYDMEANPRHAELIIEHMLGKNVEACRTVTTPGSDADDNQDDSMGRA